MSISSEITRINTNIANSYTAVDNKNGTLPQTQNSANLATAINSIEVIESATAEGESLNLANTKVMPYSDYVVEGKSEQDGEPSPSNPSEIHSVADDVNLLENMTIYNSNHYISPLLKLNPGTYTFNYTGDSAPGIYIRKNDGSNPTNGTVVDQKYTANNITFSISETGNYYIHLYSSTIWEQLTMNNPKLQKGTVATPYSPYNQGTVTIKQRGTTENNDYTFQTEPLRSLPNGVKDTIEAEQHRKIGRQTGTLTETTTITLSDAKTNGAYMCNIKPSGTLTGKTIELEAGDYEIIYELEEEIIEPLTQNQATTMLDIIKTGSYEGTTNIYTDEDVKPTMKVDYYKKK